ncbi:MAG: hypothetical protein Q8934_16385 [Bacillota bacterium]|nr:hypothetical protein [Bacillota bacterium]
MKKSEKTNIMGFKDKYNSGWICVLKHVQELRKAIVSNKTEQIHFWPNGTWACYEDFSESSEIDEPLISLKKRDLQPIKGEAIKSMPFSICELMFGINHFLCELDVHEYVQERKGSELKSFLSRDLLLDYYHLYHFEFKHKNIHFHCVIEWEKSHDSLRIKFDEDTMGIADGIRYIINYLFELSKELYDDYPAYSSFCKEIRKFEEFYCKTLNLTISQTTTPSEVSILEEEIVCFDEENSCFSRGNFIRLNKLISHFELNIPIMDDKVEEKMIGYEIFYDIYHDFYGFMDVNAIEWAVIKYLENDENEAFETNGEITEFVPSNSYDFSVPNKKFEINYRIEWDSNNYFNLLDNSSKAVLNFNYLSSLLDYFDKLSEKITDYNTRIIYYSRIAEFGRILFEEKHDYNQFNYILSRIERMESYIDSEFFGLIPF